MDLFVDLLLGSCSTRPEAKRLGGFKSEKVTSWSRLGAILRRFPRHLGVKNSDFSCFF